MQVRFERINFCKNIEGKTALNSSPPTARQRSKSFPSGHLKTAELEKKKNKNVFSASEGKQLQKQNVLIEDGRKHPI